METLVLCPAIFLLKTPLENFRCMLLLLTHVKQLLREHNELKEAMKQTLYGIQVLLANHSILP